ncbi:MAG: redoxin domain-containing protein [Verrucomicrobiales bacterium]|nr:redoxin domain-containing protein [Verrucomicrobiales bacterium]
MKTRSLPGRRFPRVPGTVAGLMLLGTTCLHGELPTTNTVMAARARLIALRSPELQRQLGVDPGQIERMAKVLDEVDLPLWQLRDLPPDQGNAKALPLFRRLCESLDSALLPDQLKQLDQIAFRLQGWQALQLPSVVDQLRLDGRQEQQYSEFLAGAKALAGRSPREVSLAEFNWIQQVLTAGQRNQLKELLGAPIDFSRHRLLQVKAPEVVGVDHWINSAPLKLEDLRGKVVVVTFWTFGCINCIHNLPHYRKWHAQLPRDRVTLLAYHTPETAAEHDLERVKEAVQKQNLRFPIAVDERKENWKAWGNNIWPSVYLVDKQGYVRAWWYGELNWQGATGEQQMRARIRELMAEPQPAGEAVDRK